MNIDEENLLYFFTLLERCRGVTQSPRWHPEGDVFQHTLQVLRWAFRESQDADLLLAAMLHDIGKAENSHGHAEIAVKLLQSRAGDKTLWLIAHHIRIWRLLTGEMMKKTKIDYLVRHPWLPDLLLLARWDKMGRNPHSREEYDKIALIEQFRNLKPTP